jgi:AcrR family transcriptional regulator
MASRPAQNTTASPKRPSRSKKQERRHLEEEISRRFILDAAEQVFARQGFQNATVREIAAESEFSASALYNFFDSKEDLFAKVMERKGRDIVQALQQAVQGVQAPTAQLHALADAQLSYWSANRDFYRLLVRTSSPSWWTLKAELDETSNDRFLRAIDIVTHVMRDGRDTGVFVDDDPETMAVVFLGIMQAYLVRWLSERDSGWDGLAGEASDPGATEKLHALLDRAFGQSRG